MGSSITSARVELALEENADADIDDDDDEDDEDEDGEDEDGCCSTTELEDQDHGRYF